jgi:hypothetical protein
MGNFIKKLVDGNAKNQGNCCGVEIKEVTSVSKKPSESCSTTETSTTSSCCSSENSSACCG